MTESSSPKEPIHPKDQEIEQENEGFYHIKGDSLQGDHIKGSHQDIYNLLKFAEDIKQVCDNYLNQLESLIFWRDCIVLALLMIAFLAFFNISNRDWNLANSSDIINLIKNFISTLIGLWILSLAVSVMINPRIKKLKSRFSYEQKILEETVDLLREAGSIIKQEGHWTTLQEIEYKIRLSRFNIGKYQIHQSILQEILSRKSDKTWYNRLMNKTIEELEKSIEFIILMGITLAFMLGVFLVLILVSALAG